MINFLLRPAHPDDLPAIKSLVRNAQINPTGLKWTRFVIAENEIDGVIGCGQIKSHLDGSHELASLVVDPDYRGLGIARSLVDHLTRIHKGDLFLMCRSSLGDFYKKLGFVSLTERQMPPYFRRINRLASLAEFLSKDSETLLVMHRTC